MKILGYILIAILVIFIALCGIICYSLCVMASERDQREEAWINALKQAKEEQDHE